MGTLVFYRRIQFRIVQFRSSDHAFSVLPRVFFNLKQFSRLYFHGFDTFKTNKGSYFYFLKVEVTQSCLTLRPHELQPSRLLCPWGFPRQEYWSGLPFPSQGDLSHSWIKSRSPAMQADSLLSEPPGKPTTSCFLPYFFFFFEREYQKQLFISWHQRSEAQLQLYIRITWRYFFFEKLPFPVPSSKSQI